MRDTADGEPSARREFVIAHGPQRAAITETGACLRAYDVCEHEVIAGFAEGGPHRDGRGMVLMPWPNRIDGGTYAFGTTTHALALSEPRRGHAIHGLVDDHRWRLAEQADERVTLTLDLPRAPGYPFRLHCSVTYELGSAGLSVTTVGRNDGDAPLPYGTGQHPYIASPAGRVDNSILGVPSRSYLEMDARKIPTGRLLPVAGSPHDFQTPAAVGRRVIDVCFGALDRDEHGIAEVTVGRGPEVMITVWMDAGYRWVMVYSCDEAPAARHRNSVAIEPMTCPPNAFRTGIDLITLEPGRCHTARWGITPSKRPAP